MSAAANGSPALVPATGVASVVSLGPTVGGSADGGAVVAAGAAAAGGVVTAPADVVAAFDGAVDGDPAGSAADATQHAKTSAHSTERVVA